MSPIDFSSISDYNTKVAVDNAKYATGQDKSQKKADGSEDNNAIIFISQAKKADDNSQLA